MPTKGIPKIYVPASGPIPAQLMIVGEAPGQQEINMRKPFVGPSSNEIFNLLYRFSNIVRDDCYVTNVFKYPLEKPESKITQEEWLQVREELANEIIRVQPTVILALGAIATHALLLDSRTHDMETVNAIPHFISQGFRVERFSSSIVIPSFHPAASFRDSSKLQYLVDAFRAVKRVLTKGVRPERVSDLTTEITEASRQLSKDSLLTALDTETLSGNNIPYIVSASSIEGEACVVVADDVADLYEIAYHVSRPDVTTLLHNALFDLPVLEQLGIIPSHWVDTMTVAFLLQYLPLSLKELTYRLLSKRMRTYGDVVRGYRDLSEVEDRDSVFQYAASDPSATLGIYNAMKPLWYPRMDEILQLDMDIQPMVVEMMKRGMGIRQDQLQVMDDELDYENVMRLIDIQNVAEQYGMGKFNPRSSKQLAELLYDKLKLGKGKRIKRTDSKRLSTSKKMTAMIKEEHPVVVMIEQYKETATLRTSFLQSLQKHIKEDGRIHADFSMTRIPHSGRFAISKPNLLAIPVRSENGRKIREAFVATEGYTFVSGDLSQIEMRCMAHNSQDEEMLKIYRNDDDIHTQTGMRIFGINDPSKLDEYKHRIPAKTTGFGILNLISAQGLSRELITNGAGDSWTVEACQNLIDSWFGVYKGVRKYLDYMKGVVIRNGFVADIFGRKERIPQIYSADERTREEGIRIACNQQIQSSAQGIIKTIMRNIWVKYGEYWIREGIAYPIIQLHDDILHECRLEYVNEVASIIKHEMENTGILSVPIKVGMKQGKVWGNMIKMKEDDDEQ